MEEELDGGEECAIFQPLPRAEPLSVGENEVRLMVYVYKNS
jgi:hypothetical protein